MRICNAIARYLSQRRDVNVHSREGDDYLLIIIIEP